MQRTTRFGILLLVAILASACAQDESNAPRPTFAGGGAALPNTNATLRGQSDIACQAMPQINQVKSGAAFAVSLSFSGGTAPYALLGSTTGLPATGATVTGSITLATTTLMQVFRRISVQDSRGLLGSCTFSVLIEPTP